MGSRLWVACAAAVAMSATAWGAGQDGRGLELPKALELSPLKLVDQPESVYAPPAAGAEEVGENAGGVHLDLTVSYLTDYVFRGVNRFDADISPEDAANLQVEGLLKFDLGKMPHPFIGVFVNTAENDRVSSFQEIRPYVGAEWTIRPLTVAAGGNLYLFPNRPEIETSEAFVKLTLDDSYFLRSDEPLLSPYIYGAYDFDLYNGWYAEAGVEHAFRIEDTGIVLTVQASVGYVHAIELFTGPRGTQNGFQHYQVGLIGTYSLNTLFNVSRRFGEWQLKGYLFYTDGIADDLRADTGLWGGMGIGFSY